MLLVHEHPSDFFRADARGAHAAQFAVARFRRNSTPAPRIGSRHLREFHSKPHYVERVKRLAYLDGLTGIFNRRYFEMRIVEEIERARRYGNAMAVIMADIDDFKCLNDEFGHLLGDEVLRQISPLFHQQLRKIDVVCRYGGEEFAILLTHTIAKQAAVIAEKLRKLVGKMAVPGCASHGDH
jgi:diguanylate cyclase (GGDEF)-like protein